MNRGFSWAGVALLLMSAALAGRGAAQERRVPGAAERWSEGGAGGKPEFARHVVPLFSKLGCNMRSCHGSFQGQNGFRLSLFGFEPELDRGELLEVDPESEGNGPRADLANPGASLMLRKPTSEDDHGGGRRMPEGGWQYRLLKQWIAAGAAFDAGDSKLVRFELLPSELVLAEAGEPGQLTAMAWFDDGTVEDVTGLTTFTSNDESIATVDASGSVSVHRAGDAALVAQYMGGVASAQALVPAGASGAFPPFPYHNPIDEHVAAKLRKLNVHPSNLCSDADFIRRVYLDVVGTLPSAGEVREFLADRTPRKRSRLIDRLLDRPEYALYWGMKFSDWTGNSKYISQNPQTYNWMWQKWIEDKLSRNVPYDEFVYGFLCATSLDGRSRDDYLAEVDHVRHQSAGRWNYDDGTYARRRTNDLYWINVERRDPDNLMLQTANSFLGMRLECAQCHNHPYDRWTQKDFEGFKSFFMLVRYCDPVTGEEKKSGGGRGYGVEDVQAGVLWRYVHSVQKTPPKILGGETVPYVLGRDDPRIALWEWMRAPGNAYFAPSIVNRIWAHYFGVGIVDPADDFNLGNPPSNPQLLEWLARDFIDHGFDLKHLHRTILTSRTYQLSFEPNESNRLDRRNFSHAQLRRLPAEVLMDAIAQVTGVETDYGRLPAGQPQRAVGQAMPPVRYSLDRAGYAMQIFGRPDREKTCDCERSNEPSVAQAMYLANDSEVLGKLGHAHGRLAGLLQTLADDSELIDELYLTALARPPSDVERQAQLEHVRQASSRDAGMRDVVWSLLNVREFVFNH